jgi:hypothetical protein
MLFGESANAWRDLGGTHGSAKRTLYLAIKHAGYPLDAVLEADITAGYLRHYSVLYVVEPQVSAAATTALAAWVQTGGRLYTTAAALTLNEFNESNVAAAGLFAPSLATPQPLYVGSRNTCPNGVQDHRCEASL